MKTVLVTALLALTLAGLPGLASSRMTDGSPAVLTGAPSVNPACAPADAATGDRHGLDMNRFRAISLR